MKITIYELLGMIKDGKAPKKIKFHDVEWEYKGAQYQSLGTKTLGNIWNGYNFNILNDKVEILEEKEICHKCHKYPAEYNQTYCEFCLGISKEEKKIPEKLGLTYLKDDDRNNIIDKINEIIDYLDYLKSKGDE